MRTICIGTNLSRGVPATVDLDVLLRTRLLVQASSGGGKSWLLRLLCEQLSEAGVQVFVLDPEGEFPSLREKYDYLIAGAAGSDVQADPATAALLARRLLGSGTSAVLDLFELTPARRREFVREFLTSMVDAPKSLWREVVVVLDEAHLFAPESGRGESVALEAVMSMATRGRKRGYCLVPATQRLSKLHKDVAAECNNVMIGPTTLDLDRERAADALGVGRDDRKRFMADIKMLQPGTFHALGRALSVDSVLVKVGQVATTHPEPGRTSGMPPAAAGGLADVIASLSDLPKQAEDEAADVEVLQARVAELQALVGDKKPAEPVVREVVKLVVPTGMSGRLKTAQKILNEIYQRVGDVAHDLSVLTAEVTGIEDEAAPLADERPVVKTYPSTLYGKFGKDRDLSDPAKELIQRGLQFTKTYGKFATSTGTPNLVEAFGKMAHSNGKTNGKPAPGMQRIVDVVATLGPVDRHTAALCALMTPGGGTFKKYIGIHIGQGAIASKDGKLSLGPGQSGKMMVLTPAFLLPLWKQKLSGRRKDILDLGAHETSPDNPRPRKFLAEQLGMEVGGGTFKKYFGELVGMGLFLRKKTGYHVHPCLVVRK